MNQQPITSHQPPAAEEPKVEVRVTRDGSATLYVPALDEHYHSHHGARQESEYVFIQAGLLPLLAAGGGQSGQPLLNLLEVGLGTGLNALLTLHAVQQAGAAVAYDGLETRPLPTDVVAALASNWSVQSAETGLLFHALHAAPWGAAQQLAPGFHLTKRHQGLLEAALWPAHYHLIYFDAFAPDKQPELWTEAVFQQLYAAAAPGAVLVSYCAQGQFRRNLRAAGWHTEKLPGPPGKREMTRARKP
ncbi:tRNA (5-methylaminomethyl-2-thiouridine)(34)-methyltransferase MnmD [Hymenobacter sp. BT683]|uniref:tRNA (5-methylaminomethyl-2-thiouridine)(34)-methyltransferase MnmD n=1 Tax=Hymenobacter jeongseonensis TaxID=2791027 RepID=A0ABS0IKM7_9BACT|nr:tRNA (5-methylaminomethyl-2-thiouridine)(34)-methyltransferase MnmD [Hymenobacter jeongseonensis]MBF9238418.1 tRNA (5-methylaminomethyl-2-thiouridine)(34)-methyltransferase MnmD [Hymenobacter jeongseonensis]